MARVDVALEEFKVLRAELLAHLQAQTTLVSVALTATAAIAGFAFGAKPDDPQRLEILLALPLVLSGLGLAYMTRSSSIIRIGSYVKKQLWPVLQRAAPDDSHGAVAALPSWEHAISPGASWKVLLPPEGWLTWLPGVIIFGAPSVAALFINGDLEWWPGEAHGSEHGLEWAWFTDFVLAVVSLLVLILSGFIKPSVPDLTVEQYQEPSDGALVEIVATFADGSVKSGTATLRSRPSDARG
jgi:hypothetical protein